jgi:ribosomal protein S12 methylthiotransferase
MAVAEEISAKLLKAKIGKRIRVIVDSVDGPRGVGRSQSDAPEIDGLVHLLPTDKISKKYRAGEFVKATVVGTQGHDLIAQL